MRTASKRICCWFSCGTSSAIAIKLVLDSYSNVIILYCDPGSEVNDNKRFLIDCENWFDKPIQIIKSEKFNNVDEVIEKRKYLAGIKGAPCSVELKKIPRQNFQQLDDIHVFGFTFDWRDKLRAERMYENNPELNLLFPLIEQFITKLECKNRILNAGIELPLMSRLGYDHDNCVGCVKSGSVKYWIKIKNDFPEIFVKRCKQSRKFGAKLLLVKGLRYQLDQLSNFVPNGNELEPDCDLFCGNSGNVLV